MQSSQTRQVVEIIMIRENRPPIHPRNLSLSSASGLAIRGNSSSFEKFTSTFLPWDHPAVYLSRWRFIFYVRPNCPWNPSAKSRRIVRTETRGESTSGRKQAKKRDIAQFHPGFFRRKEPTALRLSLYDYAIIYGRLRDVHKEFFLRRRTCATCFASGVSVSVQVASREDAKTYIRDKSPEIRDIAKFWRDVTVCFTISLKASNVIESRLNNRVA